ncbi:MAG: D-2-hydroxyacid dehydrogenase family protein [Phycisphaerales bacterium]|nr:D-2-hydroxyacid dehydrogenase family protein [Phycisphaerales bacterium]MCB9854050.1 D-2-hydroxyacid dehydrogenase family protein [Phycisphaerales bacterium]MCB9864360.1 D-2-hydroxyacid dehydrogenase family protein [Phycisphaerales bacterium]
MIKPKLLALDDYEGQISAAPAMKRLRALADVKVLREPLSAMDRGAMGDYAFVLALRERTRLDAAFFDSAHQLELVLQTGGHAYHVDLDSATRAGVTVALGRRAKMPRVVVPELTFGLIIALRRQIAEHAQAMATGAWRPSMGRALGGSTLGMLGCGRQGLGVARLGAAFGMRILAWDRGGDYRDDADYIRRVPLEEVLRCSDVVSIHLKLSDESRELINAERLALMKPDAILINTSRGAIIDESALAAALQSGKLAGAGLDVFVNEPLSPESPLRIAPNALLTPHIGWQVAEVVHEFVAIAAEQLAAWCGHELSPDETANPSAAEQGRRRVGGLKSGSM